MTPDGSMACTASTVTDRTLSESPGPSSEATAFQMCPFASVFDICPQGFVGDEHMCHKVPVCHECRSDSGESSTQHAWSLSMSRSGEMYWRRGRGRSRSPGAVGIVVCEGGQGGPLALALA